MKSRRLASLLVIVALLGCHNEKNRNLLDKRTDQATRMGEVAQRPAPKKSFNPLTVTDKVWAGSSALKLRSGLPLPSKFEGARGVTLIAADPMSSNEVATAISSQIGIPVRIATSAMTGGGAAASSVAPMSITYEGPLTGLLDMVAGHYGLSWKYDGASINFTRFVTKVFVVEAMPGTQTVKDGIKEDDGGSSSSSSSAAAGGSFSASSSSSLTQSAEMSADLKVWDEFKETIQAILGGTGSVVVSPSNGTITVSTTPDLMRVVSKYVEEENRRQSQQVGINVEVYSVALADGTDFNVAFATALDRISSNGNVSITGAAGPTASSDSASSFGTISTAILNPKGIGQITSVFKVLSTIGDTARVAQFPLTTLNNRPISRRIGRDRTYVAGISTSESSSTSSATNSVTPGTIREGFSIQLTPRILEDGRVMLQYSFSLVDIVQITPFDTGSGKIELPETASRVFVQQSLLRSGSTLVLAGYDDENVLQNSQGVGSPYNYFLGGGSTNTKSRTMLYIAITPQVLETPAAEKE